MSKKTVLVTGATGLQGGSVARHLLRSGKYNVRGLTRKIDTDKARALRQAGAEVVAGDLGDLGSLRAAMAGSDVVFGVTNFWEHFEREREHGKNLVDAVAEAKVPQFVFSTLPAAKRTSGIPVPHLDIKAEIEQYARERGLNAIYVNVAFYYENFINFQMLQRQPDGTLTFGFPQGDTPLAALAIEDLGGVIAPLLERFDQYAGKVVGAVGEDAPCSHYAEVMTRALGRKSTYQHIPREVYATFPFPGAEELGNMFEFNRLHVPNRKADLELCRTLYPAMQDFETWLKANKATFQPLMAAA
jgi:uncharacterized protein YbjT (DUF2867 family)